MLRRLVPLAVAYALAAALIAPAALMAQEQPPPAPTATEQAPPPPQPEQAPAPAPAAPPAAATDDAKGDDSAAPDNVVRAAGANAVSIKNFAFAPSTITVHVGDSVTWTNGDKVGHSATANDGSFDTGIVGKGESGSASFSKPGTFAYHCTPHPYMKGTVKVLAASSGGGNSGSTGSSGSSGSSPGTSAGSTTAPPSAASSSSSGSSGPGLAATGLDAALIGGLGVVLLGLGLLLHRRVAREPL